MLTLEEIGRFMSDDKGDERKRHARVGRRYYEGVHDIKNYRIFFFDKDGELKEDTTKSNVKISHPFFTELVDQCVQYELSGERFVVSDDSKLQEELDGYFGDDFKRELSETVTDMCAGGWSWMSAVKEMREGKMRTAFYSADCNGVIEVRAKECEEGKPHIINWYVERIDKGRKAVRRIEVWDDREIRYYVQVENGRVSVDSDATMNPRPHILAKDAEGKFYSGEMGYIPFFRLDANRKRQSHLKAIKAIIDDYDLMSCGFTNNIQDFAEALYVVKGFDGDDLDQLTHNLKAKKAVGVSSDGGVEVHTIDIPREARMAKLDLDEKNIYRFGMGLNTAQVGDGNVTNVVIKSRYALLDMKCNKMEQCIRAFVRRLVRVALDEINKLNGTAWDMADVKIEFEREIITNATDNAQIALYEAQEQQTRVATLLNAATVYGDDAVLEAVCAALDLDAGEVRKTMPEEDAGGLDAAVASLTGDE